MSCNNIIHTEHRDIPCGGLLNGSTVHCKLHDAELHRRYPQGWVYYPGDTCPHGAYIGGSGRDRMCVECELG